jgi:DNA-binding transcriptional MerR regulator
MRIGELAALVGVTPRTVRHYHRLGLLPEPERLANGYRDYGLRQAVLLARVRRLTELGLGLAEVRDVLADDAGRELAEVLEELDADLARRQEQIARRRAVLRQLRERAERGELDAEGPVSPGLARLLGALGPPDSPMEAKDRSHLALMDTVLGPEDRDRLFAALRPLTEDGELMARVRRLYVRLDELADAPADDPRAPAVGEELAECMPGELLELMEGSPDPAGTPFDAFLADFAPAQAAAVRRMLTVLMERRAR